MCEDRPHWPGRLPPARLEIKRKFPRLAAGGPVFHQRNSHRASGFVRARCRAYHLDEFGNEKYDGYRIDSNQARGTQLGRVASTERVDKKHEAKHYRTRKAWKRASAPRKLCFHRAAGKAAPVFVSLLCVCKLAIGCCEFSKGVVPGRATNITFLSWAC